MGGREEKMTDLIKEKYVLFLGIAAFLQKECGFSPVLYGSLGLGVALLEDLDPQDIDILIPRKCLTNEWESFQEKMRFIGYTLIDAHEHAFLKDGTEVAFGEEEDLWDFANIDPQKLQTVTDDGVSYKVLSLEEYDRAYKQALKDGYRQIKKTEKDEEKLRMIHERIRKRHKNGSE